VEKPTKPLEKTQTELTSIKILTERWWCYFILLHKNQTNFKYMQDP